jgi:hypothetical protein
LALVEAQAVLERLAAVGQDPDRAVVWGLGKGLVAGAVLGLEQVVGLPRTSLLHPENFFSRRSQRPTSSMGFI